ncbi:COG3904 family protein [Pseudooctadecabacter jejudonensis]|uniref:Clp protease n=1 Tax=Pseudooctadecabacter jejudonensis TaxID=1391910 RepID=A0A1Y5SQ09_9RHOB|nr:hypothetical protein [Pseudooctadecabacter jejudonensis]SLN44015.1 hypothetical protein PSJ8397_02270 [Pseudooctadecabacter jejudonensis]
MTDTPPDSHAVAEETTSGANPVRRMIYGVLAVQLALALFLMGGDLLRVIPQIGLPSTQPRFDQPVNPGDQTRRYRPADMPLAPARDGNPARPYTSTGDMPDRLAFDLQGEVLTLTGRIAPGDAARFEDFMQAEADAGRDLPTAIRLNSPGGSVSDALAIGTRLREDGIDTVMNGGDICLSACPYVLSAGVTRSVDDDAQVGVHQHFFDTNTILPAFLAVEDIQRGQGRVMTYLIEMGVDPEVMQHALVTPPDEIYVLLPEQLNDYGIVTPPKDQDAEDQEAEG